MECLDKYYSRGGEGGKSSVQELRKHAQLTEWRGAIEPSAHFHIGKDPGKVEQIRRRLLSSTARRLTALVHLYTLSQSTGTRLNSL